MKKTAIVLALLACSTAVHANTNGNELFSACRNFAYRAQTGDDWFNRGVCSGTIEAAAVLSDTVCPPKGSTHGQSVMIVVNYMTQHPETIHLDIARIAAIALTQAWPCGRS
jgi:Rap1a immunity proteins